MTLLSRTARLIVGCKSSQAAESTVSHHSIHFAPKWSAEDSKEKQDDGEGGKKTKKSRASGACLLRCGGGLLTADAAWLRESKIESNNPLVIDRLSICVPPNRHISIGKKQRHDTNGHIETPDAFQPLSSCRRQLIGSHFQQSGDSNCLVRRTALHTEAGPLSSENGPEKEKTCPKRKMSLMAVAGTHKVSFIKTSPPPCWQPDVETANKLERDNNWEKIRQ